ncbi:MAG: DUF4268 domain-containing protein [Gaiellales bacterium]
MTSDAGIARIEWLDLRAVWRNEAADFTPWLLENVDVLRDALDGLEIELERAEHPIGNFSLDLIGRDLTHGSRLIVENQIETTDHGHLGQLLTYAAGSDAGTIIWVAKAFREEHRVALEWLNEHTDERTRFFGVVVRALRVGASQPAPFLEVAAKPSDWQKSVRSATSGSESAEHAAYRAFWAPLRERLMNEDPALLKGRSEPKSLWLVTNSPIHRTSIAAEIGSGELRVHLEIDTGDRERNLHVLQRLRDDRATIEAAVGELEYLEGNYRCKIVKRLPWPGKLLTEPDRYDEAREWFYENLGSLRRGVEAARPAATMG